MRYCVELPAIGQWEPSAVCEWWDVRDGEAERSGVARDLRSCSSTYLQLIIRCRRRHQQHDAGLCPPLGRHSPTCDIPDPQANDDDEDAASR